MSLLATRALTLAVGDKHIGDGLDLAVEPGQTWAVLGPNGAGKTTLLHTLAGLRRPGEGEIRVDDRPLARLSRGAVARRIGVLLQDSLDPFPATVRETVLIGRHPHLAPWQWEGPDDHAAAEAALAAVGLDDLGERSAATLSGGERRRLAIATLLAQQPRLYLLDEPTNHLDLHHQIQLLQYLRGHAVDDGGALVMAVHDINLAARFCDHALLIFDDGEMWPGRAADLLHPEPLSRLYRHPIEAVPWGQGRAFLPT